MSRKNDTFIARRSIPVSCRGPDFSWWNTSGRKMSRRGICIHRTPAGGELWRMTALTRYFINMHQLEQALFFNFEELVYSFFLPPECSSVLFQIYIPSAWTWLITLSTIYNSPDSAPLLFLKKNKQKKEQRRLKPPFPRVDDLLSALQEHERWVLRVYLQCNVVFTCRAPAVHESEEVKRPQSAPGLDLSSQEPNVPVPLQICSNFCFILSSFFNVWFQLVSSFMFIFYFRVWHSDYILFFSPTVVCHDGYSWDF